MDGGIELERLGLLEHWSVPVAVILHEAGVIRDNAIEVFVTKTSLAEKYGGAETQTEMLIHVMDYALRQKAGLVLYGLAPAEIVVRYQDLLAVGDVVDSICVMLGYRRQKVSLAQFLASFRNKHIYFLGNYPAANAKRGDVFSVHTMKSQLGEYAVVPVFLTAAHADAYNVANHPKTRTTLDGLMGFYSSFGVLFEPRYQYWMEIPPRGK